MPRRCITTVIPHDCVFRFDARVRIESSGARAGLRVTIPPAVLRGLGHLGWGGGALSVKLGDQSFAGRLRRQGASMVLALPRRHRGNIVAGDRVTIELRDPGPETHDAPESAVSGIPTRGRVLTRARGAPR